LIILCRKKKTKKKKKNSRGEAQYNDKLFFINTAHVKDNILHETSCPHFAPVSTRSAATFEKHGARKPDLQIGHSPAQFLEQQQSTSTGHVNQ
jgi:hypothetical protein